MAECVLGGPTWRLSVSEWQRVGSKKAMNVRVSGNLVGVELPPQILQEAVSGQGGQACEPARSWDRPFFLGTQLCQRRRPESPQNVGSSKKTCAPYHRKAPPLIAAWNTTNDVNAS
jgi:hypothetical protein